jgi:hypothetical protein
MNGSMAVGQHLLQFTNTHSPVTNDAGIPVRLVIEPFAGTVIFFTAAYYCNFIFMHGRPWVLASIALSLSIFRA